MHKLHISVDVNCPGHCGDSKLLNLFNNVHAQVHEGSPNTRVPFSYPSAQVIVARTSVGDTSVGGTSVGDSRSCCHVNVRCGGGCARTGC